MLYEEVVGLDVEQQERAPWRRPEWQEVGAAARDVLELKGELPRRLGDPLQVYRPSQQGPAPSEQKIKEMAPHEDPWAKHMNAILPQATTPPGM